MLLSRALAQECTGPRIPLFYHRYFLEEHSINDFSFTSGVLNRAIQSEMDREFSLSISSARPQVVFIIRYSCGIQDIRPTFQGPCQAASAADPWGGLTARSAKPGAWTNALRLRRQIGGDFELPSPFLVCRKLHRIIGDRRQQLSTHSTTPGFTSGSASSSSAVGHEYGFPFFSFLMNPSIPTRSGDADSSSSMNKARNIASASRRPFSPGGSSPGRPTRAPNTAKSSQRRRQTKRNSERRPTDRCRDSIMASDPGRQELNRHLQHKREPTR
jgi:hypothetical protein